MKRSPERKQNRLPEYNYSNPGYYFITICTHEFIPHFGSINKSEMHLNERGVVAKSCWDMIPKHFDHVGLDEFIVMPNHVHGIIGIEISINDVGNTDRYSLRSKNRKSMLIPKIVGAYKSSVTRNIKKQFPQSEFKWQKSYYDHIIRDKNGLEQIRHYIKTNPENWLNDKNYTNL
ncbi:MAG TPA: hypothetical protein DD389_04610 [Candidatus Marinimicrobia bacterium]|nr:hypothetical protein [Candidatus Neomarinimicrobiota bacterium]HJL73955.1 transposase [Candidatus Neomarinimicrobiota bacterium]